MARSPPVPSTRAGERETRLTPATSGGGVRVSLGWVPMVSETQPLTLKKKKSTSPQTSPWT